MECGRKSGLADFPCAFSGRFFHIYVDFFRRWEALTDLKGRPVAAADWSKMRAASTRRFIDFHTFEDVRVFVVRSMQVSAGSGSSKAPGRLFKAHLKEPDTSRKSDRAIARGEFPSRGGSSDGFIIQNLYKCQFFFEPGQKKYI